jgi:hypothetical protein
MSRSLGSWQPSADTRAACPYHRRLKAEGKGRDAPPGRPLEAGSWKLEAGNGRPDSAVPPPRDRGVRWDPSNRARTPQRCVPTHGILATKGGHAGRVSLPSEAGSWKLETEGRTAQSRRRGTGAFAGILATERGRPSGASLPMGSWQPKADTRAACPYHRRLKAENGMHAFGEVSESSDPSCVVS